LTPYDSFNIVFVEPFGNPAAIPCQKQDEGRRFCVPRFRCGLPLSRFRACPILAQTAPGSPRRSKHHAMHAKSIQKEKGNQLKGALLLEFLNRENSDCHYCLADSFIFRPWRLHPPERGMKNNFLKTNR
jgi:hypothetical protein